MPDEDYRKLTYCIEYKSNVIGDEGVNSLIKQTIEEVKKKNPEKAKALDRIEIRVTPLTSTLDVYPLITLAIEVILAPIIIETWHEIVIPLLKRKLNIEPYEDHLKKMGEKIEEWKKEKVGK